MVPLAIRVAASCADLNGVGSIHAAAAIPVNPQAKAAIIEIEVEVSRVGIGLERKRVHPVRGGVSVALLAPSAVGPFQDRGFVGPCPEIESELTGPEVPVGARRNRDTIILAIEVKRVTDLAGGKSGIVQRCIVMSLNISGIIVARPPGDHIIGWRDTRTFTVTAGVEDFSDFVRS